MKRTAAKRIDAKRMDELKNRLTDLPCPYCEYKGGLLNLLAHALSKHRINLIAQLSSRRRRKRRKGAKLRFVMARSKRKGESKRGRKRERARAGREGRKQEGREQERA